MSVYSIASTMARKLIGENEELRVVNRTGGAVSKGDVLAIDLTGSDSDVKTYDAFDASEDRDDTHPFSNAIAVATAQLNGWFFVVALEDAADDEVVNVGIRGVFEVELDNTVAVGHRLMPVNADTKLITLTDGSVSVGIALDAGPDSGTALGRVLFDGRALGAAGSAN